MILGLNEVFNVDVCLIKVNFGVGVYMNEDGKILLLCVVCEVEKVCVEVGLLCGYLLIDGIVVYDVVV